MSNAAQQVLVKVIASFPVLTSWPLLNAIMQDGLQPIEFGAFDIDVLIDDNSRDLLLLIASQDASFGWVQLKSLGLDDLPHQLQKNGQGIEEFFGAGEGQVIRIPRVFRLKFPRESSKSKVQRKRREVCQCW